ncbi:MAG: hypothetical protein NC412_09350 [Roseburia sp.]|nr:hypothetical protein [Roseburia sp.]MCM1278358.1 hypothetical protein [Robinsoniella sp.]
MQLYQFEKIYSEMEKDFGKIKSGDENAHSIMLFPLEGNALKIYKSYPSSNSRRLREAIALVLFRLKENYTGINYDTSKFRNEDNCRLETALLMAFDPLTNPEVKEAISADSDFDISDLSQLRNYYKEPIICLLRIKESIDTWEKRNGANGYFDFIEQYMGQQINGDEMLFSILKPFS